MDEQHVSQQLEEEKKVSKGIEEYLKKHYEVRSPNKDPVHLM